MLLIALILPSSEVLVKALFSEVLGVEILIVNSNINITIMFLPDMIGDPQS